jgi:DNA-binding CsgD family transcriptional regulator
VLGSAAYARSRQRVAEICERDDPPVPLRQWLLGEMRRVVGFDTHVFVLTDPETSVGVAPLSDVAPPMLPDLPRLIRLKYLSEVNRWTALGVASPPAVTLLAATRGDPARSLVWREMLEPNGVHDVASCVFRDRFGCWGFLDLWRTGGPFTGPETAYLGGIAATVTGALRRSQARTFLTPTSAARTADPGPVVLLLSDDLDVVGQTPPTHDYLRVLVPPPEGGAPIPASAYNVAAQLLAVEAGVDANPPLARVHLADGRWLTLRAGRMDSSGGRIVVTIEATTSGERTALFARAFGLSARETELLDHLRAGRDTRDVAGRMHLSEHTVQDHLKSIFTKTGTRSRRTLLSRATGT